MTCGPAWEACWIPRTFLSVTAYVRSFRSQQSDTNLPFAEHHSSTLCGDERERKKWEDPRSRKRGGRPSAWCWASCSPRDRCWSPRWSSTPASSSSPSSLTASSSVPCWSSRSPWSLRGPSLPMWDLQTFSFVRLTYIPESHMFCSTLKMGSNRFTWIFFQQFKSPIMIHVFSVCSNKQQIENVYISQSVFPSLCTATFSFNACFFLLPWCLKPPSSWAPGCVYMTKLNIHMTTWGNYFHRCLLGK
jgi:hypothetical protein